MYHRIVLTSGISLLMNLKGQIERNFPDFFNQSDQTTEGKEDLINEIFLFLKEKIDKEFFNSKLSAEISMIEALNNQNKLQEKPVITIFYTDTIKGTIAAKINEYVFNKYYSAYVKLKKIINVDVTNRVALSKSIGHFLSDVSNALEEGEPSHTCFAPIGGYKILTSMGYLVGALHRYPTAYLHEGTSVLHEIPPINIKINDSFVEENHHLFRKLIREEIIELKNLSKSEQNIIEKDPTFFSIIDDLVALNPFGNFVCNQSKFAHYFQSNVYIDTTILNWLNKEHKSKLSFVMKQIYELVIKHRDFLPQNQNFLFHESAFKQLNGKETNCHLYKGSNKDIFRAIWTFDTTKEQYYIGKIWLDHDKYERQAVLFFESFNITRVKWKDITSEVFQMNKA